MHMVLKKIIYEEDMLRKRFKHTKKFGKKGLERFTLFLRMKKQTKGNAMQKTLGYMKNNSLSSPFFHFFPLKKIYIFLLTTVTGSFAGAFAVLVMTIILSE